MTKIDTGNPAFPTNEGDTYDGMTLRDYFAAKAMNKMIARAEMHFASQDLHESLE